MKRVCLVSPKAPALERAAKLGLEVTCVYRPDEYAKIPAEALRGALCVVTDFDADLDRLVEAVRAIHERTPFEAVFTVQEEGVLAAAHLNDALGLRGTSTETVARLTDKWRMRQLLAEAGADAVAATPGSTLADIEEFGRRVGYPLIIKPVGGSASVGVQRIDSAEAAAPAFELAVAEGLERFLIEEYLDGPEISVDALSFDGVHVPIGICAKTTGTGFIEFGHTVPAPMEPATERQVEAAVAAFLDVVGLRDGLSHTELKLTAKGPRVIESHNRRGGDRINTMVEHVHGVDLEEAGLAWAVGEIAALEARPAARGGAAVVFFEAEPGRLVSIEGAEAVRALPEVVEFHLNFEPGDLIPRVRWSLDRAGYLVVVAESAEQAQERARALADQVRFHTEPVTEATEDGAAAAGDLISRLDQSGVIAPFLQTR